jgi:hypothetical protein
MTIGLAEFDQFLPALDPNLGPEVRLPPVLTPAVVGRWVVAV